MRKGEHMSLNSVEQVGSYSDFITTNGLELGPQSVELHSQALVEQRLSRAASLGISLEELHTRSIESTK